MDTNNSQSASGTVQTDILYFSVFFPFIWSADADVVQPVNLGTTLALVRLRAGASDELPSESLLTFLLHHCAPSSPDGPLTAGSFAFIPAPLYTPHKSTHSYLVIYGALG